MCATAYQRASAFTFPIIISARYLDGTIESKLGSMTLLNADGWAATAAHAFNFRALYLQHQADVAQYNKSRAQIEGRRLWSTQRKQRALRALTPNPKWVVEERIQLGREHWSISTTIIDWIADLALIKLQAFDATSIAHYPAIKQPIPLLPGTSLCKLGFPFMRAQATIDGQALHYSVDTGEDPGPCFPMNGIFTQEIDFGRAPHSNYDIKFIETSTPSLEGQSGGPVVDASGVLWGILCKNRRVEMALNTNSGLARQQPAEPTYLHFGWAVHPETLIAALHANNIAFTQSDY